MIEAMPPDITPTRSDKPMICPALKHCSDLYSATNLVVVNPNPNPATNSKGANCIDNNSVFAKTDFSQHACRNNGDSHPEYLGNEGADERPKSTVDKS